MKLADYKSMREYLKTLKADIDGPVYESVELAEKIAAYLYEQKITCPGGVSHSYDDGVSLHWGAWTLFIPGDSCIEPYARHGGDKHTHSWPVLLHIIDNAVRPAEIMMSKGDKR